MRDLASIQKIKEVRPIPNADAIEVVTVNGWEVVVKKGEFSPGDLCVYFEIDSVIPISEEFEFLRSSSYVKKDWLVSESNPEGEGFRLKTVRLRKQISQGLVVPLSTLFGDLSFVDALEGLDLTESLGVVKWDPPLPAQLLGKAKGNFPSFIPKTEQVRWQNIRNRNFTGDFEITTKMDGSSMTVYLTKEEKYGVCSRNLELDIGEKTLSFFEKIKKFLGLYKESNREEQKNSFVRNGLPIIEKMKQSNLYGYAIQGELCGPGIQKNSEKLNTERFFVYDIYDIVAGKYIDAHARKKIVDMLGIEHVPVVDITDFSNVKNPLEMADKHKGLMGGQAEGLVFKSVNDPSISFKAISNSWLMKNEG